MKLRTLSREQWMQVRVAFLAMLVFLGAGLVLRRAYELQVERSDTLREMAEDQYLRDVKLAPKRGSVLDRHGAELAVSVAVDSVYANPRKMRRAGVDPNRAAQLLANVLGADEQLLRERFALDRYFVWVKRHVTPAQADRVTKLELDGVELTRESKRYYPNSELAAHVLGFSNLDGTGVEGIELALDERLKGSSTSIPAIRDRSGRVVFSESLLEDRASLGDDVTLTIDKTIQSIAERELELGVRTFEAQAGSVVVMDPNTGEILALANFPTFNPNDPSKFSGAARRNRAVTDRYEPGSTVKPFTVGGALSRGTVRANQLIDCQNGEMQVAEYTIHDTHAYAELTPSQILAQSSNVGTAKTGTTLGKEGLYQVFRSFGFGTKTGVLLPGETAGILRHWKRWYDMDAATIAFGQGLSVNTLQLTLAMGAIANGGKLVKPVLVRHLTHAEGTTEIIDPAEVKRTVMSPGTARLLADMLTEVTAPSGTGAEASLDGYLAAGKTGTAQKADYLAGGYAKGKWLASFVGFVPANQPRLVISVAIDEPMIAHYGGTVAGPVFRRVAEASLRYLGVPPRNSVSPLATHREEKRRRKKLGHDEPPPAITETAAVAEGSVPSLVGFSARRVLVEAKKRGFDVAVHGTGVVVSQVPAAGTQIGPEVRVEVTLAPPQGGAETLAPMDPKLAAAEPAEGR